uniref:hypothetical protein n=1 Tax=Paractinoplanes polyasparticus TaxID=2856853 RepID=UPI001C866325|nr:hypothetical protein [Actinoplanes polyasparticus]
MPDETSAYSNTERAQVAELLARVPRMTRERVQRLTDELQQEHGVVIERPETAQELAYFLSRSSHGLTPLRDLVRSRTDYFDDNIASRNLLFYLDSLCGEQPEHASETPEILRRIIEVCTIRDTREDITFDRLLARVAYFTTLERFDKERFVIEPSTTVGEIVKDLVDLLAGEIAARAVLDFLSRLAHVSQPKESAILRDVLNQLVDELPLYRRELQKVDRQVRIWQASIHRRVHVLVRVEREMDSDPDESARDQAFTVTTWRYSDDRMSWWAPPAHPRERSAVLYKPETATGAGLAAHIRSRLPRNGDARTVVELMADDDTLMSSVVEAAIDDLGRTFAVVLRPMAASAETATWFANWRTVMEETDFETANFSAADQRFDEPVSCAALVVNNDGASARLPSTLLAANVPIAAWTQRGGVIEVDTKSCRHATFDTPELFHEDRRAGRLPTDAVLMWHNPHWFPFGRRLKWRPEGTAA